LLVDTIDTIRSGVPHAIEAFKKHWVRVMEAGGTPAVRIDSTDLARLTLETLVLLNDADLPSVKVVLTNDMSEYVITKLKQQFKDHASRYELDVEEVLSRVISYPAGTMPGTCFDQPALGGVAKLMELTPDKKKIACLKIAYDTPEKTSIPGTYGSAYIFRKGKFIGCVLYPIGSLHIKNGKFFEGSRSRTVVGKLSLHRLSDGLQSETIQATDEVVGRHHLLYNTLSGNGFTNQWVRPTLDSVRRRVREETEGVLDWPNKRVDVPQTLPMFLTPALYDLRQRMIAQGVLREDMLTGDYFLQK
jgi:hypothetical protein